MTSFTTTWNVTYEGLPADSEDAKDGASRIRSFKLAFRERAAVDHFIAGDEHDGKHKKISLRDFGGDPTLETDDGGIYVKLQGGLLSLFYKDKAGTVIQLTNNGGGAVPTGATFSYLGTTAPAGYVLLSGRTIGNAASGGTERANADTEALFTLIYNSHADAEAPVSGGRGANAAADFAANKTITLPDARGRVLAGWDNMTGSSANRLTGLAGGVNGDTLGGSGGEEAHTLLAAESGEPGHGHTASSSTVASGGGHTHNIQTGTAGAGTTTVIDSSGLSLNAADASGPTSIAAISTVGGHTHPAPTITVNAVAAANAASAHNTVQPVLVENVIAKL